MDEVAFVEEGVKAEEKQGSLFVYDKDGNVVARFSLTKVEHRVDWKRQEAGELLRASANDR